jgi:cephalosporin-C deacetylase
MPILDFPLEKLKSYQGINPRPGDLDAFWDASLAEMRAVDPQIDMRPAPFNAPFADCFDLYFTAWAAPGCTRSIFGRKTTPDRIQRDTVPRYSGDSGDWFDKLPYSRPGSR